MTTTLKTMKIKIMRTMMTMQLLISSTLHPLPPLPLKLEHDPSLHLVVLEPGQRYHHEHVAYHDDDHVHLYPPSSVCLTPIQTGLSTGRTRCSSSTSRWKSSIWIMIWYDDNADKDNAYNDDNDDEDNDDNDDKDDETSPRVSNSSIMLRCLWQLNLASRKSASSSRVLIQWW